MGVFGSIMVGSASRFSSKNQPPDNGYAPDVSEAQIARPPAPMEYQGLKVGPDFQIEYEANQAPPIDGSMDLLRSLSPFMIQVEPPLAYAAVDPNASKKDIAGILSAGSSGAPAAFRAARNRVSADIPGGSQMANAGSVEQFVSGGLIAKPKGASKIDTKKLDGSGPSRIGTPALADVYTAVDITMQLRSLLQTPPLILLINPQSLSMSYSKLQQFSDRTRYGFVFQAWGEEQPKLSISAKCGAFVSGGRGVQWASRRDSAAWQNLATAFHFYRHNGYIYDTVGKSNAHHFVGALSIHYDGWVYYGNMESFTYTLDEATQHGGVSFEMEFTVNAMVDTSKQSMVVSPMRSPIPSASDPRYFGQENRALPSEGDVSVGGPNGVQVGGSDFFTVAGVEPGDQFQPDAPPLGQQVGPGLLVAPSNAGGFVPVQQAPTAAGLPIPQRRPTPFGFGR